jgi:uncharacterized protein (UPF0218 family)
MQDLSIPKDLRPLFKKPFGELLQGKGLEAARKVKRMLKGEKLIVVGDVTLQNMLAVGVKPDLAIVDLKTKRKDEIESSVGGRVIKARNPAGTIAGELWEQIQAGLENPGTTILVDGEEDLAVLPCIMEADWDTVILYGQPDEGIVYVKVDEENKMKAGMILKLLMERGKNENRHT